MKMERKLQKIYLTYYNLLVVQTLWQALYQILSEGVHIIKIKYKHNDQKSETSGIK